MTADRIVIEPAERRQAVLRIIRGARKRLGLTIFRCNDAAVLDEVRLAIARGVVVDVLLTRRASGWRRRLDQLRGRLEGIGANVTRHGPRATKHHAKYIVADSGPLLVASFNLTRKCFHDTCDFAVVTADPGAVTDAWRLFESDLAYRVLPESAARHSRLVVGPEWAGRAVRDLLSSAERRIAIIDHKLDDLRVRRILARKVRDGVCVDHIGTRVVAGREAHGKMTIVDGRIALVGSLALSTSSLGLRRELSVLVDEPTCVARLETYFAKAWATGGHDRRRADRMGRTVRASRT